MNNRYDILSYRHFSGDIPESLLGVYTSEFARNSLIERE